MQPPHSLLQPDDKLERCGVILATGEIVETANLSATPELAFEIPAAEMIRPDIVATWHTHPTTTSNLSHEDYAGFLNWPDLKHFIIGTDGVQGYVVDDGLVLKA